MTGSSTRMLPLLLLFLFVSSNQSKPTTTCKTYEFSKSVGYFGKDVENCAENCSSIQDTDKKCKCLNLTITVPTNITCKCDNTAEKDHRCDFYEYFLNGLTSLKSRSVNYTDILVRKLKNLVENCKEINFCSLTVEYESDVSPKSFHKKLESVMQQIQNELAVSTSAT